MDVYSELEVEILAQEMQLDGQGLEPEIISIADDPALQAELTQAEQLLNGEQAFDPYALEWLGGFSAPEDSQTTEPDDASWLAEFVGVASGVVVEGTSISAEVVAIAADKPEVNFTTDDDDDPGVVSWGTIYSIGDIGGLFGFGGTNIAGFDGDTNTGLDGTPGDDDQPSDEIIVVGTRTPPDIAIIRGPIGSGTYTYIFGDNSYDNENDWLNAMLEWLLEEFENSTPFGIDPTLPVVPFLNLNVLESLPITARRALVEILCGCRLPTTD